MKTKAYFELSKSTTLKHYKDIENICDEVSYSHKTNYEVGKLLETETDCSYSVHSLEAARTVEDRSRVWFFSQGLTTEELDEAFTAGIVKFVVDNTEDFTELMNYVERNEKKIELLLRMKLQEHTVQTGKHFVFGFSSAKLNEKLAELAGNENISRLGIHFHRKTQNISEWSLLEELEQSIYEENWSKIDVVNIGGGIPSIYKNFRSETLPVIFEKIAKLRTWLAEKKISMIIEPGRYIAAPSVTLTTHVVGVYDGNVIVDASIFNAAMDTFIAHHRLLVEGELDVRDEGAVSYTIKGSTPDSLDIFRYRVYLPKLQKGDCIKFLNAGAYNFSTDFCKLPQLQTRVIA